LKIAYVLGGLPFGGIENLMFDIAKELKSRNVNFKIINLSGTGVKTKEFLEENLPVVNLGNSLKEIKTFRIDTALKLRKFFKDYKPQIVHSMHFSADYFSRLAAINLKSKVITHIHNVKVEKRLERKIANKLLSYRTNVFLSVSKEVYKMVEKEHNIAQKPHYVLYNAINPRKFKEKTDIKLEDHFYLLCIGRFRKVKNFDIAIKAYSLVTSQIPNSKMLLIGDGKDREKLENLVKKLNLQEKVEFLGYRNDIPAILKKIKRGVLLMPSSYEGFPITHIEAMYAGIPAIISPFVPSKEIASSASLITPIDEKELAKSIVKIYKDKKLYEKLSSEAKRIASNLTIEKYTDKLLKLYESLINDNLPKEQVL